jgi:hypothetical protein
MSENIIVINRAPVLTLWGAVVAERQGYDRDAALTLGKGLAGLNAQAKGRMIGVFSEPKAPERFGPPKKVGLGEDFWVEICGRGVPCKNTDDGVRAVVKDKPISPEKTQDYLERAFGESLGAVREAMETLTASFEPEQLAKASYGLYERFRPSTERGKRGWGQKGKLDLDLIRSLGKTD